MIDRSATGRGRGRRIGRAIAAMVFVTFAAIGPASAQSAAKDDPFDGWRFEVTPYLWAAGVKGDIKNGRLAGRGLEVSFDEIWDNLNFAAMGTFEARKDRWGILFDGIYLDLSDSKPTPDGLAQVDTGFSQQMYSLSPTYRVLEDAVTIDLLAGVRFIHINSELDIPPGRHPLVLPGRNVSASNSWWGGFGGVRLLYPLPFAKEVSLVGYLDAGAIGGNFMWQGIAGANWRINETFSAKLGYRYIGFDLSRDDVDYDLDMAGPYLGVGIRF